MRRTATSRAGDRGGWCAHRHRGGQTASASNPMQVAVNPSIDSVGQVSCRQVACAIGISDGLGVPGARPHRARDVRPAAHRHQPDGSVEIIATGEFVFKGNDVYSATATSAQTKTRAGRRRWDRAVRHPGPERRPPDRGADRQADLELPDRLQGPSVQRREDDVTAQARRHHDAGARLGTTTFYSVPTKAPNESASGATCARGNDRSHGERRADAVRAKVKVA